MKRVGLAVVVLAAMFGTARAQTVVQEPDRIVYSKRTFIACGGTEITGTLVKPDGAAFLVRPKAGPFASLIKYRASFNPELQKSQDQL